MSEIISQTDVEPFQNRLKAVAANIDQHAIGVLLKLKEAGYDSYIVGGAVRDLLLGLKPKDFDIATNASPQQVKRRVPYCFIIGRRFKLVHARRGEKIFEIATYRREATPEELEGNTPEDLLFVEENFFGNLKEDAFRRDFTINALFYDPIDKKLIDHCNGLADISSYTIRMIGEPIERIKEDPIRILRALRLAHKLNFQIEPSLRKAISENIDLLERAVLPRRREEWIKLFKLEKIDSLFSEVFDLGIFKILIPTFQKIFENENQRENFISLLRRGRQMDFDANNTVHLYALIIYCYLLSLVDHPLKLNLGDHVDTADFQKFLRDELGVFKAEWMQILSAFQLVYVLMRTETYVKKGERRQRSLLNNENFMLALRLGALSSLLSASDVVFWNSELERLALGPESQEKYNPDKLN
jgi:poly(A) polymerase